MPESDTLNKHLPDPRYRIEVVDHTDHVPETGKIAAAIRAVLSEFEVPRAEISVALVDDETIHRVNRDHLNHDWPTDVITFPGDDPLAIVGEADAGDTDERQADSQPAVFGELIVSVETAQRIAADMKLDWMGEAVLYAIHGTLHLVGMDDETAADQAEMRAAEERFLTAAGFVWRFHETDQVLDG